MKTKGNIFTTVNKASHTHYLRDCKGLWHIDCWWVLFFLEKLCKFMGLEIADGTYSMSYRYFVGQHNIKQSTVIMFGSHLFLSFYNILLSTNRKASNLRHWQDFIVAFFNNFYILFPFIIWDDFCYKFLHKYS